MEIAVECRYRGRVIGWLVAGSDGFLRYERRKTAFIIPAMTDEQADRLRNDWERIARMWG